MSQVFHFNYHKKFGACREKINDNEKSGEGRHQNCKTGSENFQYLGLDKSFVLSLGLVWPYSVHK